MQESRGAEILDNAKQFDTLFSLYAAPGETQASSCQLLGVKPDATSLFHMEKRNRPVWGWRGGVGWGRILSPTAKKPPPLQWHDCDF